MGLRRERGQGLSEFSLVLVFVAIASIIILGIMGESIADLYGSITEEIELAAEGSEDLGGPGGGLPSYVSLISPRRDGRNRNVIFKWRANPASEGVDSYRIRIYLEGQTTPSYVVTAGCCTTTVKLERGQNYWWEAEAHNAAGWSGFKATRSFGTKR